MLEPKEEKRQLFVPVTSDHIQLEIEHSLPRATMAEDGFYDEVEIEDMSFDKGNLRHETTRHADQQ